MTVRRGCEIACLFTLTGVVILRPLIAESYDSAGNSITRAVEEIRDPSPARTLELDLLILVAACGWVAVHASDSSRRYRWTGLELGAALLALAGVISCVFAGNKRLAVNATVDWLCLPVLAIVLVQLLSDRSRRGVVIAAVLASACAQAGQCYEQYFVTSAETREEYQKHKTEFWAKQNVDPDSSTVEAFERRLKAQQAGGYLAHSNVTGAYLALCGFAGAGVVVSRVRRKPGSGIEWLPTGGSVLLTAAMLGALLLTKSAGAMIATGAGAVFWMALRLLRPWIQTHRRRAVLIAWVCVVVAAAAVIGHGLYHKSLPGWSLTFRWQYWSASAEMIADHPWTGVGRENFGRHYLLYKSIESPEEVSNAHNFLVQAAADWGIVGLIGVVAMLLGGSTAAARPVLSSECDHPGRQARKRYEAHEQAQRRPAFLRHGAISSESYPGFNKRVAAWSVGLLAVVVLARLPLLGTSNPHFLFYSAGTAGLCWLIGFVVFAASIETATGDAMNAGRPAISNDPVALSPGGPGLRSACGSEVITAVGVGLLVFLLHETINFALFVPASATTLFGLLAVWLSNRQLAESPAKRPTMRRLIRWVCLAVAIFAVAGLGIGVVLPVSRAASFLAAARNSPPILGTASVESQPAYRAFSAAARADVLDPTPWVEKARWLVGGGTEACLRSAIESLQQGIRRDPVNAAFRRVEARLYLTLAETTRRSGDYHSAIDSAKAALALYPLDPSGLVPLGDTQLAAGEALKSEELLHEAGETYRRALELDNRRLSWETIRRFHPRELREINGKLERARQEREEISGP